MSKIIDISGELSKKICLSENDANNSISLDFEYFKNNKLTNIYKNQKYFENDNNITKKITLKELEAKIHNNFVDLYYHDKDFYNIKVIDDIINNNDTHLVAEFKDYLIMGDDSEFLQKNYNINECRKYLPTLFEYYKSCSVIFPNYVILHENKYLFKNIRKKQKVIDNQQEQDDKKEKIKKGEIKLEENEDFFNTKAFNSILNQTNTSNVKLFFGINSKNKDLDNEETPNNIFNNIVKAEKEAFIIKQNNILKKRNVKNIFNHNKELKSKINSYNINNSNNAKIIKKKKVNNNMNQKIINNKIKNIENDKNINTNKEKNDKELNKNKEQNRKNDNDKKIKIIYSNKNKIENTKIVSKLNTSRRHLKSHTSIFETDINEKFHKRNITLKRNNSSNKKIFRKINSNKKIDNIKQKKKIIITNKELVSRIIEKIKNNINKAFNAHNSFQTLKQKKVLFNIKGNSEINSLSISPKTKINSYSKKNNNIDSQGNNGGIFIRINESNSTPNIINLNNKKEFKNIRINNASSQLKNENTEYKMIKVNSNLNISPLNEIYLKKDFYNNISTNANLKAKYNITSNNYDKNKMLTNNNNIKNKNKKQAKKPEKNKNVKNFNLNIYKISPNSIAQKYITNSILTSNKSVTISSMKPLEEAKYGSIKVIKKKAVDKKIKQRTDINNNININININSNNIYNNSNQINSSNNNNSNINNNLINNAHSSCFSFNNNDFDKKKYKEKIRKSIENMQRNESRPTLKKILLSSSSNRNVFNFKKNYIFENMNKTKREANINNNTITFSGFLTSRSSNNTSKIKNIMKNNAENLEKQKNINSTNKFKKEINNKNYGILNKNKIPIYKKKNGFSNKQ